MLKIPLSDKKFTAHSRPAPSQPSAPFHSNLTAAIQASGNGGTVAQQLSPASQVLDLAGRGKEEEYCVSAFNASFPEDNWADNLIEPFPTYDDAAYYAPRYDPPAPNNLGPWTHLRAISAPDPRLAPFPTQPASTIQTQYPSSPDAARSFEATLDLSQYQSLNAPHQSNSYGAANDWTLNDNLLSPVDQEDLTLGYTQPFQNGDRSRASSFSKPTYEYSPRQYARSSHLSVDENAAQNLFNFQTESVDKDELDATKQPYQADNTSILNGLSLQSPVYKQQSLHYSESMFNDGQNFSQWAVNDAAVGPNHESTTDLSPEECFPNFALESDPVIVSPIQPSRNGYNVGLASTSPQVKSDHSFVLAHDPNSVQNSDPVIGRPRRTTLPMTSPDMDHDDPSVLPIRSSSTKAKVIGGAKRSRRSSLNENRKLFSPSQLASGAKKGGKGGRVGGLDRYKAEQIKRKRQARSTCIRCRMKRVTCFIEPGASECQQCLKQGCECVRADFAEMTTAQTCNFLFQKSLSHVTRDRLHRITIAYPEIIDADWLLNQLAIQHKRSNIEINPITGGAWSINLDRCYELLSKLPWQQGARRLSLDDLVHNRRMSLVGWLECMLPDKKDSDFEQLLKYTNMPNRNTYTLRPLSGNERSRLLDVEHPEDRDIILMAAQLCRIILRALELKGFRTLQKELGDISRLQKIADRESVIYRTGQLLMTLRWRLALWELSASGSVDLGFSTRVKTITWSIYFWFLFSKQQLPDENQDAIPKGTWSYYAETERTWEEFPQVATSEGFKTWLLGAHELIKNSLPSTATSLSTSEQFIRLPDFSDDAMFQESFSNYQLPMEPRKISYDDSETNMTWEFH